MRAYKSLTRRIATAAIVSLGGLGLMLGMPLAASATKGLHLNKQSTGSNQCAVGSLKVDVHYTLLNDADSGFGGNYWANDTLFRHLEIWRHADGTYCVVVDDTGSFVTYAGKSPSGASEVGAGVTGTMEGGYITTEVEGSFNATHPTRGNIGTYDLECNQADYCPGSAVSWVDYFSPLESAHQFAHWGWIYHAGDNGTWLNQAGVSAPESGDITGG